jgi:hypothetical protein
MAEQYWCSAARQRDFLVRVAMILASRMGRLVQELGRSVGKAASYLLVIFGAPTLTSRGCFQPLSQEFY